MDLGPAELIIILLVVLVLFGGAKLPKLARSLGSAKREFEEGMRGDAKREEPPTVQATTVEPPTVQPPTVEAPTVEPPRSGPGPE